jgi:hypothetical protein
MGAMALAGIGAAASIGSVLAKQKQQSEIKQAQGQALGSERRRQGEYEEEAGAEFAKALAGFQGTRQADLQTGAVQQRSNQLQGALTTPTAAPSPNAPRVVQTALARRIQEAIGEGRDHAKRTARLGAYGDRSLENSINLARSGSILGMLGNFSAGSSGVLPWELQAALGEGQQWGTFGDILGAIAPVAGAAGGAAAAGSGGAAAGGTPATIRGPGGVARPY